MIMRGLWMLARGQRDGMKEFSATSESLTASLAPLIAFPLVWQGMTALQGAWRSALIAFLVQLCAALTLPLVTYEMARLFQRQPLWLRAATALNWSFWIGAAVSILAIILAGGLAQAGTPPGLALTGILGLAGGYLLWNRWFIVRAGLALGGWQAVLVTLLTLLASGACTGLAILLGYGPGSLHLASL